MNAATSRMEETSPSPMPIGSCSKEHKEIYEEWFTLADSDGDERITGNDATEFFAMSKLPRHDLKQIWALSDRKRLGYLGLAEFIVAMQLVSLAQAGYDITPDIFNVFAASEHINLPLLEGLDKMKNKNLAVNGESRNSGSTQPQLSSALWFPSKSAKKIPPPVPITSVVDGLKKLYCEKLRSLEVCYQFDDFVSPLMTDSDFEAKPMVMLLGQYSTGKTTFIKHLLKCDYPGAHIGPEPTTDRFVVVMSGNDERSIPGNAIAVRADMPFNGLTRFGGTFLSKFECSQMPHPMVTEWTTSRGWAGLEVDEKDDGALVTDFSFLAWPDVDAGGEDRSSDALDGDRKGEEISPFPSLLCPRKKVADNNGGHQIQIWIRPEFARSFSGGSMKISGRGPKQGSTETWWSEQTEPNLELMFDIDDQPIVKSRGYGGPNSPAIFILDGGSKIRPLPPPTRAQINEQRNPIFRFGDEFKRVIASLRGNDDKIRVVLNKADQVETQQLMRVYGALMWSLGKVLNTPEVIRVYIGSFNDKPIDRTSGLMEGELFEKEQEDLLMSLLNIPRMACDRRINDFVKRARAAKIHAYIISHLKKEMPMMGKTRAQQKLIDNLQDEFAKVQRDLHLSSADLPDVEHYRRVLSGYSFDKFEKLKPRLIQAVDDMLGYEIPELLEKFKNPYE